jgi:hypothetical protein
VGGSALYIRPESRALRGPDQRSLEKGAFVSEETITLRKLFETDARQISAQVRLGLDADQIAQKIHETIHEESRAIRWSWVRDLAAEKTEEILDLNVLDVLTGAWKKYTEIKQYADPKKYGRKETILVPLAEHTVTSEHHPYIEILLKDQPVGRIVFDLEFSLILKGFVLRIQHGAIWEIQTGSAKAEGSLALGQAVLLKRELKPVNFPGSIHFASGISLRDLGLAAAG